MPETLAAYVTKCNPTRSKCTGDGRLLWREPLPRLVSIALPAQMLCQKQLPASLFEQNDKQVVVGVCSEEFVQAVAGPMYDQGFWPYINFTYIPFGNAHIAADGQVACQHVRCIALSPAQCCYTSQLSFFESTEVLGVYVGSGPLRVCCKCSRELCIEISYPCKMIGFSS